MPSSLLTNIFSDISHVGSITGLPFNVGLLLKMVTVILSQLTCPPRKIIAGRSILKIFRMQQVTKIHTCHYQVVKTILTGHSSASTCRTSCTSSASASMRSSLISVILPAGSSKMLLRLCWEMSCSYIVGRR
jgi:hypothetical protein